MDKTLQDALASLINTTVDGVDTSVAFLSAELPDYIIQMLAWYGVTSFITWVVCLVLTVCYIRFISKGLEVEGDYFFNHTEDHPSFLGFVAIGWGMLTIFTSIGVIGERAWLKIWIAPKVWLVEYAANLAAKAVGS